MAVSNDGNVATDVRVSGAGTWTWATHFTNANANRIKDVGTNSSTRQLTTNAVGGQTNGGINMQVDSGVILDLSGVKNLVMGKVWRMVSSNGSESQTQATNNYIDITNGTTVQNQGSGTIAETISAYKADKTSKIMCNSGGFLWGSVQPANQIDGVQITFATGVGGDFHIGYNPLGYIKNVDWHILGTSDANIQLGSQAIWANNRPVPLDGFKINSTKGNTLIGFFSWNQGGVPWKPNGNDFFMIYRDLKYNVGFNSRPDAIKRFYRRNGWNTPGSASYWYNQGQMACGYLWVDPYTDMNTSGIPSDDNTYIRKINYTTNGTGVNDGNAFDIVCLRYAPTVTTSTGVPLENAHIKVTCTSSSVIPNTAYGLVKSPIAVIGYTGSNGKFSITEPTTPNYNTNTSYYTDSGVYKTHAPSGKFHKAWEDGTKYIITNDSRTTVGYNIGAVYNANEFTQEIRANGYVLKYGALNVTAPIFDNIALAEDTNYNTEVTTSGLTVSYLNGVTTLTATNGTYTLDQLYKSIIDYHFTTSNLEASTILPIEQNNGKLKFGTSLILNLAHSVTVNEGENCLSLETSQNITFNTETTATFTAVYKTSQGTSTTLLITGFANNSIVYVEDNSETQKYFNTDVSGTVTYYIPPTATGSWYYAVEKYGKQRQSDYFTFNGGVKQIVVKDLDDVGITDIVSNVSTYTQLDTADKIYDYVAYLRLTTPHISYGQITFRDGNSVYLENSYLKVNQNASSIADFDYDNKILTIKTNILNSGTKFNKIVADAPATITNTTNEILAINIEDANGNSSVTVLGGDDLGYQIWKVPSSLPIGGDYTTGTLLNDTISKGQKFRFVGVNGFDLIGVDISSNVVRRVSMSYGNYQFSFYVGSQIQLADDAPQLVSLINQTALLENETMKVNNNLHIINNNVKRASLPAPARENLS